MRVWNRPCLMALATCVLLLVERSAWAQGEAPPAERPSAATAHRYSSLFTAQDVGRRMATDRGIDQALSWCQKNGVTRAYIESFRDGYRVPKEKLTHARDRFRAAGIDVSGCITTTQIGKPSSGWKVVSCLTDATNQARIRSEFEYAAAHFDEIMIDDFWFTDCACKECDQARKSKTVTIGQSTYPVADDTWEAYRGELMFQLSRHQVLEPARKVNPRVRVIIKYPQWYPGFQKKGYDVGRETELFDRTWVGTETRDFENKEWGGTPGYHAYFLMRWLGEIGGQKCGGGWFDPYGTSTQTYIEQARQTVLGGAQESVLFCYGSLVGENGPANLAALRASQAELLATAEQVRTRTAVGVAAYRPINADSGAEEKAFSYVGMLGIPLAPCHAFPADAPALFLSVDALKDRDLASRLSAYIATGRPVLITDGLASALKLDPAGHPSNVQVLPVKGNPRALLTLPQATLDALRSPLLQGLSRRFLAPSKVALYLFSDRSWVIENFNDQAVSVTLDGQEYRLEPRGWTQHWEGPAVPPAR